MGWYVFTEDGIWYYCGRLEYDTKEEAINDLMELHFDDREKPAIKNMGIGYAAYYGPGSTAPFYIIDKDKLKEHGLKELEEEIQEMEPFLEPFIQYRREREHNKKKLEEVIKETGDE